MAFLDDMLADQLQKLDVLQRERLKWLGSLYGFRKDPPDFLRYHYRLYDLATMMTIGLGIRSAGVPFGGPAITPLIQECASMVERYRDQRAVAVAVITTLQKIDCYEMTTYKIAYDIAKSLGHKEVSTQLDKVITQYRQTRSQLDEMLIAFLSQENESERGS